MFGWVGFVTLQSNTLLGHMAIAKLELSLKGLDVVVMLG